MVRKMVFISIIIFSLCVAAKPRVDSMSYGDNSLSWKLYDTKEPIVAMALSGIVLWYATASGVGTYEMKKFQKRDYLKLGDVPSSGVKTMTADDNGNVWFGFSNGLVQGKNDKFTLFTKANGLADNEVNKIACLGSAVWIATANGVSKFDNGSWTTFRDAQGLAGNDVRDIAIDDNGAVWCATNNGVGVNRGGGSWKKYDTKSGISSMNVKVIACDKRQGQIWIACGEQDVNNFNGKEWNTFMDIQSGIVGIMGDTQSRIWFASSNGIFKYNGIEWLMEPAKAGLPGGPVSCMFLDDKNGDMYFGYDNGICHLKNPYPF
jgi:ligand-binding sensor domain-containing protein